MQTYRRFVSYVYQYENGKKAGNRGFIKVEARGNTCSMQIALKGVCRDGNGSCKVYGFKREDGLLKGSLLVECPVRNGLVQEQLVFLRNEMGRAGYSLHELSGVIFQGNDETMYGTQWDDTPMKIENFQPDENNARQPDNHEEMADAGQEPKQSWEAMQEGRWTIEPQPDDEKEKKGQQEMNQAQENYTQDGQEEPEKPKKMCKEQEGSFQGQKESGPVREVRENEQGEMTRAEKTDETGQKQESNSRQETQDGKIPNVQESAKIVKEESKAYKEQMAAETEQEEVIRIQETAGAVQETVETEQKEAIKLQDAVEIVQEEATKLEEARETTQEEAIEIQEAQEMERERVAEIREAAEQEQKAEQVESVEVQREKAVEQEASVREEMRMETQQEEIRTVQGVQTREQQVNPIHQTEKKENQTLPKAQIPYSEMPMSGGDYTQRLEEPSGQRQGQKEMQARQQESEQMPESSTREVSRPQIPLPEEQMRREETIRPQRVVQEAVGGGAEKLRQAEKREEEPIEILDTTIPVSELQKYVSDREAQEENAGSRELKQGQDGDNPDYIKSDVEAENITEELEEDCTEGKGGFCPFTDGVLVDCQKMSLDDIRYLDPRDQGLRNNRFVQHGYQMFGHLLLAKIGRNCQYILGVPGMYQQQEKFMADMFGFHNFKCSRRSGNRPACFGYWYRLIYPPKL